MSSITFARVVFTLLSFGVFILIVFITYRKGAKKSYDEVAQEIINDDDTPHTNLSRNTTTHKNGEEK